MDAGASCLCCIPGAGTTKACPTSAVLKVLIGAGLHIDASSGHEVERALRAGVAPNLIQLTAQQAPADLKELVEKGVLFNACSIAQHPIRIVPATPGERVPTGYLVVGHCCESGDVLTPAPGNPEALQPRVLPETRIGDLVVIGGAGAYCSGMAAGNYNSFPLAAEVMISRDGTVELIRRRQTLDQVVQNELTPSFLGR